MAYDVFLSYSQADKPYADAACHKLEASNIRCWIAPRDIRPSEDWAESIINAMDNSKILLLIFSSSSNNSPQVRREVERAVNKGLSILPFRIENVQLSKSLEYFISSQHWLDAINGNMEAHLTQLCDCVVALLGYLPQPAAAPSAEQVAHPPLQVHAQDAPVQASVLPIPPEILSSLEVLLAQVLGPIAKHLIKRKVAAGMTPKELVAALSQEIEDERERKQFLTRCAAAIR
jgi:hypothetical protein